MKNGELYVKLSKVIKSCETFDQLTTAIHYAQLIQKRLRITDDWVGKIKISKAVEKDITEHMNFLRRN